MSSEKTDSSAEKLPAPVKKRRCWVTVLLALAIFAAGLASGSAITVAVAVHRIKYMVQHPEEAPARIAARLERQLDLDDVQQAKIEAILIERQSRFAVFRNQFRPLLVMQLDSLRDEIGGVLTDPQRKKWQKMYSDLLKKWLPEKVAAQQ